MFECCLWVWVVEIVLLIFGSTILILAETRDYDECSNDGWAFLSFIAGFALFQFATSLNPFGWLKDNALVFTVYFLIYLVVGFGWSIFKWFRFIRMQYKEYLFEKKNHLGIHGYDSHYFEKFPPKASKHKARIVRWIIAWPISVFWAVMRDLVVWCGEKIYDLAGRIYQKISDLAFKDFIQEREAEREEKIRAKKEDEEKQKMELEADKETFNDAMTRAYIKKDKKNQNQ